MPQAQSHPKISIIIPVYNVVRYVKSCIQSILDQSFTDYEAIIVNDGSTDDSMVIVQSLIKDDQRFRIINQANAGAGPARNTGIQAAKGDYLAFVDSDDTVHKDYLLCLYQTITQYQADMCYCDINISFIDRPGTIFKSTHLPLSSDQASWQTAIRLWLNDRLLNAVPQMLYRRHLFSDICFPSSYVEDVAINLALLLKQPVITYCPKPLYNYHRRIGSLSTKIKEEKTLDYITQLDEMRQSLNTHQILKQYWDDYCLFYMLTVEQLLSVGTMTHYQKHAWQIEEFYSLVDQNLFNAKELTKLIYRKRLYFRFRPFFKIIGTYFIFAGTRYWPLHYLYYRMLHYLNDWNQYQFCKIKQLFNQPS